MTAELLQLDPNMVRTHAVAYEGWARVVGAKGSKQASFLRANYLSIAASYWASINVKHGQELFASASVEIRQGLRNENREKSLSSVDLNFWKIRASMLNICSTPNPEPFNFDLSFDEVGFVTPEILMFRLIADAHNVYRGEQNSERLATSVRRAEEFENFRAGRLRIPIKVIASLADISLRISQRTLSVQDSGSNLSDSLFTSLFAFNENLQAAVSIAQADEFHWKRMLTTLLPIEPEALCVSLLFLKSARTLSIRERDIRRLSSDLSPVMRAYIETGAEILKAVEPGESRA